MQTFDHPAAPAEEQLVEPRIPGVRNVGDVVRRAATRWPARTAWVFPEQDESLSFADIDGVTRHVGARCAEAGIGPGTSVALLAGNTLEFPATWLGLLRLGAVVVPLNVNYRRTDAGHVVEHARAQVILADDDYLELARAVAQRAPGTVRVVALRAILDEWRSGRSAAVAADLLDRADPSAPANVQYTSGTTGRPKGCVLPHSYWLSIAWTLQHEFPRLAETDVMLTAQPFHYIDPQWNTVSALLAGARLVVLDRFHPTTFWDEVRRHEVTYFYCLGMMPTLLLAMPASDLDRRHRVRAIQCSAIPPRLHRELEARWGVPWYEAFGMTETGADLYVSPAEHDELVGTGCLGRPRRHRQVLVVDDSGEPSPPHTTGHLLIRGHGLMSGYFADDEATAGAFDDGWFRTGDLVAHDGAGRLFYRGRTKDMIRRSGENISAVEVESVIGAHEAVDLVAVTAVPDELRGEEVLALVRTATRPEDPESLLASIAEYCGAELAYFKVPRYWRLVEDLPRTASERVAKHLVTQGDALVGAWDRKEGVWRDRS